MGGCEVRSGQASLGHGSSSRQLRGSSQMDLYTWLAYRMSSVRKPTLVPWESLQAQLSANYGRLPDLKRKFLSKLADVLHVYPAARLSDKATGLLLMPSPTHLPRAAGRANRLTRCDPPQRSSRSTPLGRGRSPPSGESRSVKPSRSCRSTESWRYERNPGSATAGGSPGDRSPRA